MTFDELRNAAIECLAKAFTGTDVPVHVVQAAVSILVTPDRSGETLKVPAR